MSKRVTDQDIYSLHQVIQQMDFLITCNLAADSYRVNGESIAAMLEGLQTQLISIKNRWQASDSPEQTLVPDTSGQPDAPD